MAVLNSDKDMVMKFLRVDDIDFVPPLEFIEMLIIIPAR